MKTKEEETGEGISKLPDDILINILSRLTIKEAAKTSVLSSRWRYLWTFFTGSLDFDDIVDMGEYVRMSLDSTAEYTYSKAYLIRRQRVLGCIDKVLGSIEAHAVEELKICLAINPRCGINNWVNFAIQKRVQRLEFNFLGPRWRDGYNFNFPSHFDIRSSFGSLTSLRLTMVNLSKEALENLLCHCPFLELLSLTCIFCLASIVVSGPSLKLKHLQLKDLGDLKDLEIDAANLVSFEYSGEDLDNVSFKHVPSLVQVSVGGYYCESFVHNVRQFPSLILGQLRTLKLELGLATVPENVLCGIPKLPNLKHLELAFYLFEDPFRACAAFFKSCPLLHKLTLKSLDQSSPCKRKIGEHNPHLSIKVAEFVGFKWHTANVEFLMDLHQSATTMEKVIIDNCRPHFLGSPEELLYRNSSEYQSARRRAMELPSIFPQLKFEIS